MGSFDRTFVPNWGAAPVVCSPARYPYLRGEAYKVPTLMSEKAESTGAQQNGNAEGQVTPWLRATSEDLASVDFEAPLDGATTADCHELSDLYRAAIQPSDGSTDSVDTPTSRVFTMLSAVAGMHFKPQERNEPFGPMVAFADGHRSAIPSDFRSHVDLLADMAERASNPVLRARLSDVCWLLDRKRGNLAIGAIAAYTDIVHKTDSNELKYRFETEGGALQHDARDYLRRALQIGRAVGWEKPETIATRELVKRLREQALEKGALVPIHWFSDLDLDFAVSNPEEIGKGLDAVLAAVPSDASSHNVIDLWRLAARAYHFAKKDDDKHRCLAEAAEALVAEAQSKQSSAMVASHFLSAAIAQLHGIPGRKDRRTALRHQLIDLQARVPEELSVFSQELDLKEIAEKVQQVIGDVCLLDKLFIFAALEVSPDPVKLASDAVETIKKHPLSSLFGASHLDREGKVIHRTQGGGLGDGADASAVRQQVAQAESIRRKVVASGKIEAARHTILDQHFISDDVLAALLQYSPFIPSDVVATFARGFMRFFQGDFASATYILTPLLENSLRYILKSNGHDVTIFDDATQTQEDRTISSLFEHMRAELESAMTPAIVADIERVFLTKPGPHLRHALAHGLFHDGDPYGADAIYACWLIFRLCLLPLFPHREELRSMFSGSELCRA